MVIESLRCPACRQNTAVGIGFDYVRCTVCLYSGPKTLKKGHVDEFGDEIDTMERKSAGGWAW